MRATGINCTAFNARANAVREFVEICVATATVRAPRSDLPRSHHSDRFQRTAVSLVSSWRFFRQTLVQSIRRWLILGHRSVVPHHRHEMKAFILLCNVTDGWKRDVRCGQ